MYKKKNNLVLIIVFAVLLLAVGVNELVKSSKGERTFRKDIIELQANDIRKISIFPKKAGNRVADLYLEDTLWKLKFDNKVFAADQEMVKSIVDELANMVPERLVANKSNLWKDYDLTDSLGIKIVVYGPKNYKTELTLGRFAYNQATRKPSTYLRVNNEDEVYAVEGYLAMTFNREMNSLRDKSIHRGNKNDLAQITFNYPADSSFTLIKQSGGWTLNGLSVDSTKMLSYLNKVSYLSGTDFRDDFIPAAVPAETCKVTLAGPDMKSVEIKAFVDASGTIINSTENPASYFPGDKENLFSRIFIGKSYFLDSSQGK